MTSEAEALAFKYGFEEGPACRVPKGCLGTGRGAEASQTGPQAGAESLTGESTSRYLAIVPSNDYQTIKGTSLEHLRIPGMGEAMPKCLDDAYRSRVITCSVNPDHDRQEIQTKSCGRIECPICFGTWNKRAADRAGARMEGYRLFDRHPPRHVILSESESHVINDDWKDASPADLNERMKKHFRMKAVELGVTGGTMIIHLFRVRKDLIPSAYYAENPGGKAWDYAREHPDLWHTLVYYSPHAHLVAYGFLKQVKAGEGFLYKNKGPLRTREDVERLITYLLGHAPVIPKRTTLTYFGNCSYRKLKPQNLHTARETARCSICGAAMVYEGTQEEVRRKYTTADGWHLVTDQQKDLNGRTVKSGGGEA